MLFYKKKFEMLELGAIRFPFLLISVLSSRKYCFFFILPALIALFHNSKNDYLVLFCKSFIVLVIFLSISIVFLLNNKKSFAFITNKTGPCFIEKRYPTFRKHGRGIKSILIFISILLLFYIVDQLSFQIFLEMHRIKIMEIQEKSKILFEKGAYIEGMDISEQIKSQIDDGLYIRGIFTKYVNYLKIPSIFLYKNIKI